MTDAGSHNRAQQRMSGEQAVPSHGPATADAHVAPRPTPTGRRPRDRQTTRLLLLLMILALLLVAGLVLPLFEERAALRDEFLRLKDEIARAQALVAAAPELRAQLARSEQELAQSGWLLAGDSVARAAAQLQTRIQTLADAAEIDLRQLQVHATPAREPDLPSVLEPVEIEMELVADIQGLQQMLAELETGRPLVIVNRLHIRARLERADPRTGNYSVMPELIVSMTVRSYHLLPTPAKEAAGPGEEGAS